MERDCSTPSELLIVESIINGIQKRSNHWYEQETVINTFSGYMPYSRSGSHSSTESLESVCSTQSLPVNTKTYSSKSRIPIPIKRYPPINADFYSQTLNSPALPNSSCRTTIRRHDSSTSRTPKNRTENVYPPRRFINGTSVPAKRPNGRSHSVCDENSRIPASLNININPITKDISRNTSTPNPPNSERSRVRRRAASNSRRSLSFSSPKNTIEDFKLKIVSGTKSNGHTEEHRQRPCHRHDSNIDKFNSVLGKAHDQLQSLIDSARASKSAISNSAVSKQPLRIRDRRPGQDSTRLRDVSRDNIVSTNNDQNITPRQKASDLTLMNLNDVSCLSAFKTDDLIKGPSLYSLSGSSDSSGVSMTMATSCDVPDAQPMDKLLRQRRNSVDVSTPQDFRIWGGHPKESAVPAPHGGRDSPDSGTFSEAASPLQDQGEEAAELTLYIQELQERALVPMKEDIAAWLSKVLEINPPLTVENLMENLSNGVHVCRLARMVQENALRWKQSNQASNTSAVNMKIKCWANAGDGSFLARDNACSFISFCRAYNIRDECLFESESLVLQKHPRNVLVCLYEVSKVAKSFGIEPPGLVKLEDGLHSDDDTCSTSGASDDSGFKYIPGYSLDQHVTRISQTCTCDYQIKKISNGKYKIGDKVLLLRILNKKHVMVRVGGGWDTLEHYLVSHDPCRVVRYSRTVTYRRQTVASVKSCTPSSIGKDFLAIKSNYKPK